MMSTFYTATDHFVLLPAMLLALFGCATLLFDFWVFPEPQKRKRLLMFVLIAEALSLASALWRQQHFISQFGGDVDGLQRVARRRRLRAVLQLDLPGDGR